MLGAAQDESKFHRTVIVPPSPEGGDAINLGGGLDDLHEAIIPAPPLQTVEIAAFENNRLTQLRHDGTRLWGGLIQVLPSGAEASIDHQG